MCRLEILGFQTDKPKVTISCETIEVCKHLPTCLLNYFSPKIIKGTKSNKNKETLSLYTETVNNKELCSFSAKLARFPPIYIMTSYFHAKSQVSMLK